MSGQTGRHHETSATQSLDAYLDGQYDKSSSRSEKHGFPSSRAERCRGRPWGGISPLSRSCNSALRACELSSSELESLGRSLDSMGRDSTSQGLTTPSQTLSDSGSVESTSKRLERLRRSLDSRVSTWSAEPILIDPSNDCRVPDYDEARQKLRERENPIRRQHGAATKDQEAAQTSTGFDSKGGDRHAVESRQQYRLQRGGDSGNSSGGTTPATSSTADENEKDGNQGIVSIGVGQGEGDSLQSAKGGWDMTAGTEHLQKVKEVLDRPFFKCEYFAEFRKAILETHPRQRWNALNLWIREGGASRGTPFDPEALLRNHMDAASKEDGEMASETSPKEGEANCTKENIQVLNNKRDKGEGQSASKHADPINGPSKGAEEQPKESTPSQAKCCEGPQTSHHSPPKGGGFRVDPSQVPRHDHRLGSSEEEESESLQEMRVVEPDLYIARKRFQHLIQTSERRENRVQDKEASGKTPKVTWAKDVQDTCTDQQ
ncbi:hypothetical protein BSKO_01426 [Bryopsis sp. KO-2023]|nr:hypothetical protein BSKO_01426 [Bryopsis sp. KO-2023]